MALGRALMIGEAMTKSPQPLSDGYNVNSDDEEVYNWLVKFDSGETFNNDGVPSGLFVNWLWSESRKTHRTVTSKTLKARLLTGLDCRRG